MNTIAGPLLLLMLGCSQAQARDAFDRVSCASDIPKALVGQRGTNEPVVKIEARHANLKLKDLGASDYGRFSSITWLICGQEVMVLEDARTDVIHDALRIPPHSPSRPEFEGICKRGGTLMPDSMVAILRDEGGQGDLPVEEGWVIDQKAVRFVKVSGDGVLCPRDGILERR